MSTIVVYIFRKNKEVIMTRKRDEIRIKLLNNNLSQVWLINQLAERGITTDKSELSSALSGSRTGTKIDKIIETSLLILHDYEAWKGKK